VTEMKIKSIDGNICGLVFDVIADKLLE